MRSDPVRTDPVRSDPVRTDPVRSDPVRSDPARSHSVRSDPVRSDPAQRYGVDAIRRVPGGVASRDLAALSAVIIAPMSAEPTAPPPPDPSSRSPAIHEHRRTVVAGDIDALGHVNNLRYLEWTLAAAIEHSDAAGWTWTRYEALGSAWVVRSHAIEYLRPAFVADEVVVRTWVSELARVSSRRKTTIARADGTLLARAETLWVFVSRRTHAIDRVPAELLAAFTVLADDPPSAI